MLPIRFFNQHILNTMLWIIVDNANIDIEKAMSLPSMNQESSEKFMLTDN